MLFNYIFDNDLNFYVVFAATAGFIGYSFVSSYLDSFYIDKGVQTSAWEDYSDRPSQIVSDGLTSIDAITPRFSPIDYTNTGTQTLAGYTSTVTTILPIPPVNIEIVPNPEIIASVIKSTDIVLMGSDIGGRAIQLADMLGLAFM